MARPSVPNPASVLPLLSVAPTSHALSVRDLTLADGRSYRLFIALPRRLAPLRGFPALYLLDGNAAFEAIDAALLARHPDLAVIGVGYPVATQFDFDARSRDYTPAPIAGSGMPEGSIRPERPSGGADAFLLALASTILPALESGAPLDAARRTLWGHSYGGLFALHALATAPDLFAGLAIASPTLWWDDGRILDTLAGAPFAADAAATRIALWRGDDERSRDAATGAPGTRLDALHTLLRSRHGAVPLDVFPHAHHRAVLDLSLPGAFAHADPHPAAPLTKQI